MEQQQCNWGTANKNPQCMELMEQQQCNWGTANKNPQCMFFKYLPDLIQNYERGIRKTYVVGNH